MNTNTNQSYALEADVIPFEEIIADEWNAFF